MADKQYGIVIPGQKKGRSLGQGVKNKLDSQK